MRLFDACTQWAKESVTGLNVNETAYYEGSYGGESITAQVAVAEKPRQLGMVGRTVLGLLSPAALTRTNLWCICALHAGHLWVIGTIRNACATLATLAHRRSAEWLLALRLPPPMADVMRPTIGNCNCGMIDFTRFRI